MRAGLYFNMAGIHIGRKRQPCDKRGIDWNDTSASQELQEFLANTRSWKRQGRIFSYRLQRDYSPDGILILDF